MTATTRHGGLVNYWLDQYNLLSLSYYIDHSITIIIFVPHPTCNVIIKTKKIIGNTITRSSDVNILQRNENDEHFQIRFNEKSAFTNSFMILSNHGIILHGKYNIFYNYLAQICIINIWYLYILQKDIFKKVFHTVYPDILLKTLVGDIS